MLLSIFKICIPLILLIIRKINANADATKYPLILVPGDGGNQLYAKLNKVRLSNSRRGGAFWVTLV